MIQCFLMEAVSLSEWVPRYFEVDFQFFLSTFWRNVVDILFHAISTVHPKFDGSDFILPITSLQSMTSC